MKNYEVLKNAKIVRETEKAILIEVGFGDEFTKQLWFPRSQVEVNGDEIHASSWILDQKQREVGSKSNINTVAPVATDAEIEASKNVKLSKKASSKINSAGKFC